MSAYLPPTIRLGLPKGRMQEGVFTLLAEAGVHVRMGRRAYRPAIDLPGFDVKLLKPQNIVQMLAAGSRDVGFAGADWVAEHGVELVELLDTGMDPVRIVAAAPNALAPDGELPDRHLHIASEYRELTQRWIEERGLDATFVRSFGATEAFPPEDADCIVDNTATGSTLAANNLTIVDELMTSSTRFYANPSTLDDPDRRESIERLVLLLRSVLEARQRFMVELNVSEADLERVIEALPSLREPTVARLHGGTGYALKAAVLRSELPLLIPELKSRGGSDVVVIAPTQIVR